MPLRIILTTGGTGGHIFPALAVAEELRQRYPDIQILFVGGQYGSEKELVERAGIAFVGLPVRGFIGRGLKALKALASMSTSIGQAMNILRSFRPNAVMGFGGYASFPSMFAAWLLRYPCALHEQNAIPGFANKLLGKMSKKICLSWPQPENNISFPPARSKVTGDPIRKDIAALGTGSVQKNADRCLLIMGGSLGARAINSLTVKMLPELSRAGIRIIHQTGRGEYEAVVQGYKASGFGDRKISEMVFPFIHDMASVYSSCDLALCRAGATSMAELSSAGIPAVYIPFPYAAHDHQTENAMAMQKAGGGICLPQEKAVHMAESGELPAMLKELIFDDARLDAMKKGARSLAHPDAAAAVADELLSIINNEKE